MYWCLHVYHKLHLSLEEGPYFQGSVGVDAIHDFVRFLLRVQLDDPFRAACVETQVGKLEAEGALKEVSGRVQVLEVPVIVIAHQARVVVYL